MELLIVVVIMGVVYTLSVGSFAKINDEALKVTLGTLKEYLQGLPHEKSVKFLCLDNCSSCDIYIDGVKIQETSEKLDNLVDETIRVYTYDFAYGIQQKSKDIFFNEENVEEEVCFSYEVDKKGIGDQVYVEFKERVYDFSTYFTQTAQFDSLEEALESKENLMRELR